jgi:hypothetical protein
MDLPEMRQGNLFLMPGKLLRKLKVKLAKILNWLGDLLYGPREK